MHTNDSALIVQPPGTDVPAGTNDIRGLKGLVSVPDPMRWVWLGLALVLLGLAAWWLWRRGKRQRATASVKRPVPPHTRARMKLQSALSIISDPRQFCFVISEALRSYLEERFSYRAPEQTTEEFLQQLRGSHHLMPDQKQSLAEFLESCDLVKFARHEPTEQQLQDLHQRALRLVEETQYEPLATSGTEGGADDRAGAGASDAGGSPPPIPRAT